MKTIALSAAGSMGAGIAHVLTDHSARVVCPLQGRSQASHERARAAGMENASDAALCQADVILSVLPPEHALSWAQQMAPWLEQAEKKPIFVDCNAISPETVKKVESVIIATGTPFVDGAIIGLPPAESNPAGPRLWFSGDAAEKMQALSERGLRIRIMQAECGAASSLKMAYAGINKGITLLASAMLINASRVGAAGALYEEMQESQSALLQRLAQAVPDMQPKAWRWAAEMDEIATLNRGELATEPLYHTLGEICRQIDSDRRGDRQFSALLQAFFQPDVKSDQDNPA